MDILTVRYCNDGVHIFNTDESVNVKTSSLLTTLVEVAMAGLPTEVEYTSIKLEDSPLPSEVVITQKDSLS